MKVPAAPVLAIAVLLSVSGCNSEPSNTPSTTDSSRNAGQNQAGDTGQPAETATTTAPGGAASEFHKVLSFRNITFDVTAKGKGSLQELTIQPSGLSEDSRTVALEVEPVVGAEVVDLNADGYPELLVFTQSAGSGSYGKVVAYSVNNGKSMSRVTFPAASENATINKGYMGHDRFAVVNHQMTQTFPLYKEGPVSEPTGRGRVVTYRLKAGEASRTFVVAGVKEVQL